MRAPLAKEPLAAWPTILDQLSQRQTVVGRLPGEDQDAFENRVGTALMALFRDTRDARCFEALYAFAGTGVLTWIRTLIAKEVRHLDPNEVLQDTFVNVYRYPGAFREEHVGSFRVWVRTIAGNVVRRALTTRSRGKQQEFADEATDLEDRSRGPVQSVLDEEQERRLRGAWILLLWHYAQAWKGLSQRDRRTLHLVEVEGLSYREAGRVLAVGRSNMKMIVFRSRKRIARRMREAMNGGRGTAVYVPELVA